MAKNPNQLDINRAFADWRRIQRGVKRVVDTYLAMGQQIQTAETPEQSYGLILRAVGQRQQVLECVPDLLAAVNQCVRQLMPMAHRAGVQKRINELLTVQDEYLNILHYTVTTQGLLDKMQKYQLAEMNYTRQR
ncbi:hypothetical protein HDR63_01240 [bacterium]|nr:hypothetical protein [bacterium]